MSNKRGRSNTGGERKQLNGKAKQRKDPPLKTLNFNKEIWVNGMRGFAEDQKDSTDAMLITFGCIVSEDTLASLAGKLRTFGYIPLASLPQEDQAKQAVQCLGQIPLKKLLEIGEALYKEEAVQKSFWKAEDIKMAHAVANEGGFTYSSATIKVKKITKEELKQVKDWFVSAHLHEEGEDKYNVYLTTSNAEDLKSLLRHAEENHWSVNFPPLRNTSPSILIMTTFKLQTDAKAAVHQLLTEAPLKNNKHKDIPMPAKRNMVLWSETMFSKMNPIGAKVVVTGGLAKYMRSKMQKGNNQAQVGTLMFQVETAKKAEETATKIIESVDQDAVVNEDEY